MASDKNPYAQFVQNTTANMDYMSPYNFNPSSLQQERYIIPEGSTSGKQRGRFEKSFFELGAAVFAGGALGSGTGVAKALQDSQMKQLAGGAYRSLFLNHITKTAAGVGQTFGAGMTLYLLSGIGLEQARGVDDELNTVLSGAVAGTIYTAHHGWKHCLKGAGVGVGISSLYACFTSWDKIKRLYPINRLFR